MISKITDLKNLKGIRISTSSYFIKKIHLKKILIIYIKVLLLYQIKAKTQFKYYLDIKRCLKFMA